MIYVKNSGAFTEGDANYEQQLIDKSGMPTLEGALVKLNYHHAFDVGHEDSVHFEIHINDNQEEVPAAIGFMNFNGTYQTYVFQSRHAIMIFLKEFGPTIVAISEKPESSDNFE
jgi:hypothetical protein